MVRTRTLPAGRPASQQGFTLLELLVVLAIIGFTLSLIPGFILRDGASVTMDRAVGAVADGLRSARNQAVLENRENLFAIDVERRQFRAGFQAVPVQIGGDIALGLVTAKRELSGENSGRIRFFPDGSSTGGRIVLVNEGDRREVEVDWLTGEIKVLSDAQ